ncbi:hypothetical protein RHMOL_Rhmol02G0114000 [Rhododendron molle]|uniref:Uncharacterized protein n=1 Tax=Rhododendron molle TaxID=49168 RepID=A0ACC0PPB9_RHOML|nr:hypothetical protein RHMOL_Rhmol02G0114000 [Rhododendron molle]
MKNLYRRKGTVHPSPPLISDHLAFLPATILTLAAALSPEDREVLAYLISCSSTGSFSGHQKTNTHKKLLTTSTSSGDHPPSFTCNCFRCYTSYWVRWDSSPSRQTIHEIIDAFEEEQLGGQSKREKSRRERRKRGSKRSGESLTGTDSVAGLNYKDELGESESVEENIISVCGGEDCVEGEEKAEKGSVRKFISLPRGELWLSEVKATRFNSLLWLSEVREREGMELLSTRVTRWAWRVTVTIGEMADC